MITKAYCDGPFGQIHYRITGEKGALPDLYCLHPAPFSGLAFTTIMPHLAQDRRVIAPDFPGHGGSHSFKHEANIADYADAMRAVMETLSADQRASIFGFHTGCLVAAEIAIAAPQAIARMVLCDVPAFDQETRENLLASNGKAPDFHRELSSLEAAWERGITRRVESQGMERSFAMFAEQLRHGEAMNAGFYAGFSYPVEDRLPAITSQTAILATQSGLLDATRRAAKLIPHATLTERLDIKRAVLDEAAQDVAREILGAL